MRRIDSFQAVTLPDQLGKPKLVLLALDTTGTLWRDEGDGWVRVEAPNSSTAARDARRRQELDPR